MRTLLLIIGIVIILMLGKIFFLSKPDGEKGGNSFSKNGNKSASGATPPTKVDVVLASMENIESLVYASGTVLPNEMVDLKAETSGRLIKLDIREGTYIEKGRLIAKINDNDLKAQLEKLEFNEQLSKQIEARQKKLSDINAISREEYEISANNLKTIGADKDLIKAQLEKTEIRAPFSGKIGLKNISEGAFLAPGTSVVTLVQTNPVKIDFAIPERYTKYVKVGNMVTLELDGEGTNYTARVIAIDPMVDANLRTLRVRALAQNANGTFFPGMFVKVQVNLSGNNSAIMIPTQAIVPILKGKKVYVVKEGKVKEVIVTTGYRNDQKVQIISGLQVGDSLIVSSIMALKKDAPVKVKQVIAASK